MGRTKRNADELWDDVEANGQKRLAESGINGNIVRKGLEDGTKIKEPIIFFPACRDFRYAGTDVISLCENL